MSRTKLLSWLIGVAALGIFYTGEAFAGLCYKVGTTSCKSILNTPTTNTLCQSKFGSLGGTWKAYTGSCSLSGTILTFNGSEISCTRLEPVGSITARRATTSEPAVWSEFADNVECTFDGGNPAIFDMFIEYTLNNSPSGATCHPAQGNQAFDELRYTGHCGSTTPRGYLKYVGAGDPPQWVKDKCINKQGQIQNCNGDFVMVLDGSPTKNNGEIDLKKCLTIFPDENGQAAGQFLSHIDRFPANTGCGAGGEPRVDSADSKRRMCQNKTFFNPLYDEETGQGPVTLPPCPELKNVSFRGGIGPNDAAQIEGVELYDKQVSPNSTQNLSCSNSGTDPWTGFNSANISLTSFTGTIEIFVKNFPNEVVTTTNISPTSTGFQFQVPDCTADNKGLDEIICKAILAGSNPNPATVDLVVRGTPSGGGLGFIGEATGININNARNCPDILK